MRYRLLAAGVLTAALSGQDVPPAAELDVQARRTAVGWATGVAGKFAIVSNTVISAYSLGQLAALTYEYDLSAASGMFRQAIGRLNAIPWEIFFDAQVPRLPVASFTGLWRMISTSLKKCDLTLAGLIDTQAFELRRNDERRNANNSVIAQIMALKRYEQDPDRTAQLADLVLEAGDPASIDFGGLELFLAKLRERSPELADDVFKHALDTVANAPSPSTLDLDKLGKYLFVDPFPDHRFRPDDLNLSRSYTVGGTSIYDLRALLMSANPDLVGTYIDTLRQMKFDDARRAMNGIADERTTRQIGPLIDFGEASAALASGDIESVIRLTNRVQPGGVKRAMLYAGIVAKTPSPQHEGYVALATRDVQSLPAEFRTAMFSVLAVALLEQKNPERAYSILQEIVVALNDARVNPRQGRFDPAGIRGISSESSQGVGSTTDIPSIPLGTNRFYMVIDTGEGRFGYELSVPGVSIFTFPGALKQAQALDPLRLEALVSGVRDDTKQAEACVALAELRFRNLGTTTR